MAHASNPVPPRWQNYPEAWRAALFGRYVANTLFITALGMTAELITAEAPQWHWLMAMSTVIALPMLIVFFLAQRYFVEGIALTGMKG